MAKEVSIPRVLMVKLPFFIFGVIVGMLIFWVVLQWVPGAVMEALGGA